jgi:hypothetical protein
MRHEQQLHSVSTPFLQLTGASYHSRCIRLCIELLLPLPGRHQSIHPHAFSLRTVPRVGKQLLSVVNYTQARAGVPDIRHLDFFLIGGSQSDTAQQLVTKPVIASVSLPRQSRQEGEGIAEPVLLWACSSNPSLRQCPVRLAESPS